MNRNPCYNKFNSIFFNVINLYFSIFIANIKTNIIPSDDLNDVYDKLRVIHYDCSQPGKNNMYALSKVAPCKITPESIQMVNTQVTLYQRSDRTFFKALMCRAKAMVLRYNCGKWSDSSIKHNAPIFTYDLIITPEQCLEANKT